MLFLKPQCRFHFLSLTVACLQPPRCAPVRHRLAGFGPAHQLLFAQRQQQPHRRPRAGAVEEYVRRRRRRRRGQAAANGAAAAAAARRWRRRPVRPLGSGERVVQVGG